MRLTEEQRALLVEALQKIVTEGMADEKSYAATSAELLADLKKATQLDINAINLANALSKMSPIGADYDRLTPQQKTEVLRISRDKDFYGKTLYVFKFPGIILDGTFTKDKDKLILGIASGLHNPIYDFNTAKLDCMEEIEHNDKSLVYFLDELAKQYEWIFNYTNKLSDLTNIFWLVEHDGYYAELFKKCPKGFSNYLAERGLTINSTIFLEYVYSMKIGVFNYKLFNRLKDEYFEGVNPSSRKEELLQMFDHYGEKFFRTLYLTTTKANDVEMFNVETSFFNKILILKKVSGSYPSFDCERSMRVIYAELRTLTENSNKMVLELQMKKLNFINKLELDDYIVVVPQTAEEKRDEGEQQHNCVGYHYDSTIRSGRDFIYFLRKKATPKKSFVTCRYNVDRHRTVEYRYKSNRTVSDRNIIDTLSAIDDIIKANESKLK